MAIAAASVGTAPTKSEQREIGYMDTTSHLMNPEIRERALANRKPAVKWRAAVDAKCRECIFDPESGLGTWRQQVEACAIDDCPLWPIRARSSAA